MTKYKMISEEFEVYVDVKITKTYLTVKAISPKPLLTYAGIDPVWKEKGLKMRLDNMGRHCVKIGADDGDIVIYPDRQGIPYILQEVVDDRD